MSGEIVAVALVAVTAGAVAGIALAVWLRPGPQGGAELSRQLEVQAAELRRLAEQGGRRDLAGEQLRDGLESARRTLEQLRVRDDDRRRSDAEQHEVVRRLATVLAGGAAKGRSGEMVLRDHLSQLPPSMLACDLRVNGKVVEFGLVLPDGRRLPIDSKWTALPELEALEAATEVTERDACARAVEKAVVARAREVAQYLDPSLTAPVAVAAVPDAAYTVLKRAHADAYAKGVVIVPYSSALPIVLFLYSLVSRYGDAADVQACLVEIAGVLDAVESLVENRFAKAATMLTNGSDELRSQLGKARGSIARARVLTEDEEPGGAAPLSLIG
jgi:hypothetical protein